MDKKLIIANWKSHKNISEAVNFLERFASQINKINLDNKEIVIAPSFPFLMPVRAIIDKYNLPIKLSAQDISPFPEGAYTGAVNASQINDLCDMTIVGHSERRELFSEKDDVLIQKVNEARKNGLEIIYCIQDETQKIPSGVNIVAYEPPTAIGSGNPDDPSHVEKVFGKICESFSGKVLYGGSIDSENVRNYIHIASCKGLLVGGASLEIDSFISLLSQW